MAQREGMEEGRFDWQCGGLNDVPKVSGIQMLGVSPLVMLFGRLWRRGLARGSLSVGWALRAKRLTPCLMHSLYLVLVIQHVSPQLPAPVAMTSFCHPGLFWNYKPK